MEQGKKWKKDNFLHSDFISEVKIERSFCFKDHFDPLTLNRCHGNIIRDTNLKIFLRHVQTPNVKGLQVSIVLHSYLAALLRNMGLGGSIHPSVQLGLKTGGAGGGGTK